MHGLLDTGKMLLALTLLSGVSVTALPRSDAGLNTPDQLHNAQSAAVPDKRDIAPRRVVVVTTHIKYTTVVVGGGSGGDTLPTVVVHQNWQNDNNDKDKSPSTPASTPRTTSRSGQTAKPSATASPKNDEVTSSSNGGSSSGVPADWQEAVALHNTYRARHQAGALEWDQDLADSAKVLAMRCNWPRNGKGVHDTNIKTNPSMDGYGQNMYGSRGNFAGAVKVWYDEVSIFQPQFGRASPDTSNFAAWGHFTQLVWIGTTKIGCAAASCDTSGDPSQYDINGITVCNYAAPGNFGGQYAVNVKPAS